MTTPIDPMAAVKVLRDAIISMIAHADVVRAAQGYDAIAATAHVEAPTSEPIGYISHGAVKNALSQGLGVSSYIQAGTPSDEFPVAIYLAPQALPATEQSAHVTQISKCSACNGTGHVEIEQAKPRQNLSKKNHVGAGLRWAEATATSEPDLSGLIELLNAIKPNYGDVGSRDVDVTAQRKRIEDAIALLATQPVAQAKPDASDIDAENLRIGRELQRAAGALPPEWELEITIERGAGLVSLRDNEGQTTLFEDNSDGISYNIADAIDLAIAATTTNTGGPQG
jgi:hypothetical protein